MSHVSGKKVKTKVLKKISIQLAGIVANTRSQRDARLLLVELLTPTERVMLAKRLAVIFMLKKQYPFHIIEKTLKVTP